MGPSENQTQSPRNPVLLPYIPCSTAKKILILLFVKHLLQGRIVLFQKTSVIDNRTIMYDTLSISILGSFITISPYYINNYFKPS
jgi:hypothetical protein